eukprot:12891318-Prorocentrum_lima.AAC.1
MADAGKQEPMAQGYEPAEYFRPFCQAVVHNKMSMIRRALRLSSGLLKVVHELNDSLYEKTYED